MAELQKIPITELRREDLTDMDEIVIDPSESPRERVRSFLEQVNNPYAQNVGEYILQVGYMDGAQETLEERMVTLVRKQAEVL